MLFDVEVRLSSGFVMSVIAEGRTGSEALIHASSVVVRLQPGVDVEASTATPVGGPAFVYEIIHNER